MRAQTQSTLRTKTVEEVADIQNFADKAGVEIINTSEGGTVVRIIATAVTPKKK